MEETDTPAELRSLILEACAHKIRRDTISIVYQHRTPVSIEGLLDEISGLEGTAPPTKDALLDTHLPLLERAGFIAFNPDSERVHPVGTASIIRCELGSVLEDLRAVLAESPTRGQGTQKGDTPPDELSLFDEGADRDTDGL